MKKINVFIDYPISPTKQFQGLSFPQVLHDYLISKEEVNLVAENDPIDIILIMNGASQYAYKNNERKILKIDNIKKILHLPIGEKIDYDRQIKPNLAYHKRLTQLINHNPKMKIVHRLDDRYRMLCKLYGYDETISWINQRAHATVYQSKYCQTLFEEGFDSIFGFQEPTLIKNGTLIYNGVDRDVFIDKGPKKALAGKTKIFHVAATGMTRKGLGTVLEYAYLLKDNPEIQFYLIGNQDQDPIYGKDIPKFSNVHKLDFTDDRYELASFYRSGDILLYPTINDCAPNVVLEAMSCGIPVIAANSGGIPEMIIKEDVLGGLLIDDKNPIYALREVIYSLEKFKKNSIKLIKKYHTKEIMGQNYLNLFKSLV